MSPRVSVIGCSGGWFARTLTLAQFARQRANLERCSVVVYFTLEGDLA